MEKEITFLNNQKEKLAGFLHFPKRKTDKGITLAHCFTCSRHQKIMRTLCDAIANAGFLVLRFDFSGNGDSEGKFEESTYTKEIQDLSKAIDLLISKKIKNIGMLGHSMGATVSMLQSCGDPRVKSLCVIAGQSDPKAISELIPIKDLEKIYEKGSSKIDLFGRKFNITKEFFEDAKKHNLKKSLNNYKNPFCVIHGDADTIIPVNSAKKLYKYAAGKKEIHIIKGGDHLFRGDDIFIQMQNQVIKWFKKTC